MSTRFAKVLWFAALLALVATAVEIPVGDLRLPDGTVLHNAVAIGNKPDGINVRHASGVTFVYYRHLPPAMRQRLGYDPARERAYYQQLRRQQQLSARREQQQKAKKAHAEAVARREKEITQFQQVLDRLGDRSTGGGTGFFITSQGHIATNHHVVGDAIRSKRAKLLVIWLDRILEAEVLAHDAETDMAILKIVVPDVETYEKRKAEALRRNKDAIIKPRITEFPSLPLSRKKVSEMGAKVFTVGFPQPALYGWTPKLAEGTVSSVRGYRGDKNEYQLMMPIHGGNSGGAVIELENGGVTGIASAGIKESVAFAHGNESAATISYARKIHLLGPLLKKIEEFPFDQLRPASKADQQPEREALIDYARRCSVAIQIILPPRRTGIPFDE